MRITTCNRWMGIDKERQVGMARGMGGEAEKWECYKGQEKKQSHEWCQILLR